jgi:UDP-galactopyranose mutase
VFEYLSRYTKWRNYEHRVLANVEGVLVPIPINIDTVNRLYGLSLDETGIEQYLETVAEKRERLQTSEDVVLNRVGRDLYQKMFQGYTRKQWGLDPSELDASVTARIPVRTNRDDRYFTDVYQAMPLRGYTHLFENMLDHPNITVELNTDYRDVIKRMRWQELVYTGPVDEFFDYRFGELPYRSLRFEHATFDQRQYQPVAVVNYPGGEPFTRITEFKHLTGQEHRKTSIVREYPCSGGDPYYPVPRPENAALYRKYEALCAATPNVHFVGRLATYKYYNMDQVVAQALTLCAKLAGATRDELLHAPTIAPMPSSSPLISGAH